MPVAAMMLSTSGGGGGGIAYYRALTVDHTKIGSSDLTNYPVLISVTDATLKTVANGGHVHRSDGFDIFFTTTATGSTQLPFERLLYDGSTGKLICWVRAASLSHTVDTLFGYLRYGDSTTTTDQSNKTGVWDSSFLWVVHGDAPGVTATGTDSTANANNLSPSGTPPSTCVSGVIYGAIPANGGGLPTTLTHTVPTGLTTAYGYSFWRTFTTTSAGGDTKAVQIGTTSDSGGFAWDNNTASFRHAAYQQNSGGSFFSAQTASGATGTYLIAGEWDGSNLRVYVNGSLVATTAVASLKSPTGNISYNSSPTGQIEEIRLTGATTRGASWLLADYNTQNSPSTFTTLGAETPV